MIVLMGFLVFMTPVVMVVAGIAMLLWARKKPGGINNMAGYRTERSCASPGAWDFAQNASSKYMIFTGLSMFALTLAVFAAVPHLFTAEDAAGILAPFGVLGVQIAVGCLVFPYTESKLKRHFGD